MNSVRFSARSTMRQVAVLIGSVLAAFHGWTVYYWVVYMPDINFSMDDLAAIRLDDLTAIPMVLAIMTPVGFVVGVVASIAIVVECYRLFGPGNNYLLLDQSGFSYMRRGKSRHWPWSVLPGFKTVLSYRQVRFLLPEGKSEPHRLGGWIHEVTPDGPVAAIHDIYDTPLEEIAARLNEYRDRALAGVQ